MNIYIQIITYLTTGCDDPLIRPTKICYEIGERSFIYKQAYTYCIETHIEKLVGCILWELKDFRKFI